MGISFRLTLTGLLKGKVVTVFMSLRRASQHDRRIGLGPSALSPFEPDVTMLPVVKALPNYSACSADRYSLGLPELAAAINRQEQLQ